MQDHLAWVKMHWLLLHVMMELHMGYMRVMRSKWILGGKKLRVWFQTFLPPDKLVKSFEYIPCIGATKQWDGLEIVDAAVLVTPKHDCTCTYHSTVFAWGESHYRGAGQQDRSILKASVAVHSIKSRKGWFGMMDLGVVSLEPNDYMSEKQQRQRQRKHRIHSLDSVLATTTTTTAAPSKKAVRFQRSESWWGQDLGWVGCNSRP